MLLGEIHISYLLVGASLLQINIISELGRHSKTGVYRKIKYYKHILIIFIKKNAGKIELIFHIMKAFELF
jgi:hypothetical protein